MAATDDFRDAIKAGELLEALKTALSESIELEITTWISLADPYSSDRDAPPQVQPGYRMHSRINIVDGKIDTEVGSHFVGNGPFTELREFHINQIRSSRQIIKRNLSSIQKLFGLWADMQHQDFENAIARLESAATQPETASPTAEEELDSPEIELPPTPIAAEIEDPIVSTSQTQQQTIPLETEEEDDFFEAFDADAHVAEQEEKTAENAVEQESDPLDDIFGETEAIASPAAETEPPQTSDNVSLETIAAAAAFTSAAVAVSSSAAAMETAAIDAEEPLDAEEAEIMNAFDSLDSDSIDRESIENESVAEEPVLDELEITESSDGAIAEEAMIPIEDSTEWSEGGLELEETSGLVTEDDAPTGSENINADDDEIMAAFDTPTDLGGESLLEIASDRAKDEVFALAVDEETAIVDITEPELPETEPAENIAQTPLFSEEEIMAEFDAQVANAEEVTDPEVFEETLVLNPEDPAALEETLVLNEDNPSNSEALDENLIPEETAWPSSDDSFAQELEEITPSTPLVDLPDELPDPDLFAAESEEETVAPVLDKNEDPFAETEELLESDPFAEAEEELTDDSDADALWTEEETVAPALEEDDDPFAEELPELEPLAAEAEEELTDDSDADALWTEEETVAPALEEDDDPFVEELLESDPFAEAEEELTDDSDADALWIEEETVAPALEEDDDPFVEELLESDPFAEAEEELTDDSDADALWTEEETVALVLEEDDDPFAEAEEELTDDSDADALWTEEETVAPALEEDDDPFAETEELLESDPFAEAEEELTDDSDADALWTEEETVAPALEEDDDPFAETEELLESDPFAEAEEELTDDSDADALWTEEETVAPALEEDDDPFAEELLESDPFAEAEEELTDDSDADALWTEEETVAPALEEDDDPFVEELLESDPFAEAEEELTDDSDADALWTEEETVAPALEEDDDPFVEELLESDPFAEAEEELTDDSDADALWIEEETVAPALEEDPFAEAEEDLLDLDLFATSSSEEPLEIPDPSEEEEAEILSAFETQTMSETIWDEEQDPVFTTSSGSEGEEEVNPFADENSGDVSELMGFEEDEELLDVFGVTEELDFGEPEEDFQESQSLSDAKAVQEIAEDMLGDDLWGETSIGPTAPTVVDFESDEIVDELPSESLNSLDESAGDTASERSEALEDLLSEEWDDGGNTIAQSTLTEELVLEDDDIDPLADLFADDETDSFAESLDLSEESSKNDSGLLDAIAEDPFAELEDPFAEL
ncbi:hypothetical protein [Roseofilum casamattae]|uniref:Uncharacterized protein n=1 Tax=Roseofilum casamattae BLCC-M143 TaxID=3022442 RepID=A0ABT7BW76_9CYAN|nr:hypothetical protein [Roseofilum casamattae]MDJ1183444.1 hypothetical protein [Roseofilum casamattae BLCC-M143]